MYIFSDLLVFNTIINNLVMIKNTTVYTLLIKVQPFIYVFFDTFIILTITINN